MGSVSRMAGKAPSRQAPRRSVAVTGHLGLMAAIGAMLIMSTTPPLAKKISVDGLALAFHRFFWLALGLSIIFYVRGHRLSRRSFALAWPAGVLFGANIALFYTAVKLTSVANATVIGAIQPALSLLVVGPLFGEKVRRSDVMLTAVAIAGVVIVVYGSSITPIWSPLGDLLSLLAILCWTGYLVVTKRARVHLSTIELQLSLTIVAGLLVLPLGLVAQQSYAVPTEDLPWLALLVVVPGLGHTIINWSHAHTSLLVVSLLFLAVPALATTWAIFLLDEPVNAFQAVGMGVVLTAVGVLIVTIQRRDADEPIGNDGQNIEEPDPDTEVLGPASDHEEHAPS